MNSSQNRPPKQPILRSRVKPSRQLAGLKGPIIGGMIAVVAVLSFSYPYFYVNKILPNLAQNKEAAAKKNSRGAYLNSGKHSL